MATKQPAYIVLSSHSPIAGTFPPVWNESIKAKIDKIDLLEQKTDKIYAALSTLKWISVTIGIGVVINIFSQPILSRLFQIQ